jgi:hypothetical protein
MLNAMGDYIDLIPATSPAARQNFDAMSDDQVSGCVTHRPSHVNHTAGSYSTYVMPSPVAMLMSPIARAHVCLCGCIAVLMFVSVAALPVLMFVSVAASTTIHLNLGNCIVCIHY